MEATNEGGTTDYFEDGKVRTYRLVSISEIASKLCLFQCIA